LRISRISIKFDSLAIDFKTSTYKLLWTKTINKMKKLAFYLFVLISSTISYAQAEWNWPEDDELKSQVMEAQANYKDIRMPQKDYKGTMVRLNWLYNNAPNLHESIYQDGAKCLKAMMKQESDKERIEVLKDSVIWMFDQRLEHFDNDAKVMDRKVYEAFRYYYKNPKKFAQLDELYTKAYELNGDKISKFNLNSYMLFAKNYHKTNPGVMTAERVLDIHTTISEVIENKLKRGEDPQRLKDEQDKTDAWLSSIEGILSCQYIEENLVPKFRANPNDLANAKKIFKYSLKAKCTNEPFFLEVSEPVFVQDPTYSLANAIGSRYLAAGEIEKSLEYFDQAANLADNADDKFDALMSQATALSKQGKKSSSRAKAYQALSVKPGDSDAYNLIGNLYFRSFDDCKKEESKVEDRAVFLAAYKMYKLAGNTSQMNAAKEQFPSIEDIFSENYKEGQMISTGCWISETVEIMRR